MSVAIKRFGLCLLFVLFLWLSLLQATFGLFSYESLKEFRPKAKLPPLTLANALTYTTTFDRYFQDYFGFRDLLIKLNNSIKYRVFNISPTHNVLVGKEGWLYLGMDKLIRSFKGEDLFTPQELKRAQRIYEARRDFLHSLGIDYMLVIPPNKESVYPEFYPNSVTRRTSFNRYDQFLKHMRARTSVRVVGLEEALLKAKSEVPHDLFFKLDSHWNDFGAYYAYQEIFRHLNSLYPQLKPVTLEYFDLKRKSASGGLSRMLGLWSPLTIESEYLRPKESDLWLDYSRKNRIRGEATSVDRTITIEGRNDVRPELALKLIVYRDSFFARLNRYMAAHFVKSAYYSTSRFQFDPDLIRAERPSLVIEEFVERNLRVPDPGDPSKLVVGDVQRTYHSNGAVQHERTYQNGVQHGPSRTYRPDGRLAHEHFFYRGKKHGIFRTYYPTGELKHERTYVHGFKTGIAYTYYRNGKIWKEKPFEHGLLVGEPKIYTPQGELKVKAHHKSSGPRPRNSKTQPVPEKHSPQEKL